MKNNRQLILDKPGSVQVILKAYITKATLDIETPIYELYAGEALHWWKGVQTAKPNDVTEEEFADLLLTALRKQPPWDSILRNGLY